ncbi:MAG: hypothetical protein WA364_21495 [Candidatus Nitrosopolaris sp.]
MFSPLKECKASISAQPGSCTQSEKYAGCPSGQIKDWAGICFKESEAKACPTCAPGSAAAAEKPSTSTPKIEPIKIPPPAEKPRSSPEMPTAEKPVENLNLFSGAHNEESSAPAEKPAGTIINAPIEVKKGPTIDEKPCGKDTQRVTKSGVILCYTSITTYYRPVLHGEKLEIKKPTIPHNADLAYETGAKKAIQELAANPGRNVFTTEDIQKACAVVGFAGDEHCKAGYLDTVRNIVQKQLGPGVKPEGPVVCKGPAGTANGLSTTQPETGCRR